MGSFVDVVTGNPTLASDLNQIVDRLNGTVNAGVIVSGGASAFVPYTGQLSAAPGAGASPIFAALVSGDTKNRADLSIRSDGYGMLEIGAGTSIVGNLYGVSSGLKSDQSLTIGGALTAQGTTSLAGFTASGTAAITGAATFSSTLAVQGSSSIDNGNLTTNGSGLLAWHNTLSAGNQLGDLQQGFGLYSDNVGGTFTGGTTRLWFDAPNNGEVHIGGRASNNILAGMRVRAQVLQIACGSAATYPQLDGTSNTQNALRISCNLSVVARFQTGTTGLIINNGIQYGSGGADQAELFWSDDESLEPGNVVRVVEDGRYGGKIVRCDRENYPAAFILSTAPASIHGGQLVEVVQDGKTVLEPDPDPRWKPVAMDGRVPVKISGSLDQYSAGETFLVSSADGKARPAQEGERPRWLCVSTQSDVGERSLAPECVLALLL